MRLPTQIPPPRVEVDNAPCDDARHLFDETTPNARPNRWAFFVSAQTEIIDGKDRPGFAFGRQ